MTKTIKGVGVGLRSEHFENFLSDAKPLVNWVEVLADHFIGTRGVLLEKLEKVTQAYPSTLHCVGLSLGGTDPVNMQYLEDLKFLSEYTQCEYLSDHFCWTQHQGHQSHDLLPLPFTQEVIDHVAARIDVVQSFFKKPLLIENVSRYVFPEGEFTEPEMLNEICKKTGCNVLLDVNNVYVSCFNEKSDPLDYLDALDKKHIRQVHLAGYVQQGQWLLDTHSTNIQPPVWSLFERLISEIDSVPTSLEWDNQVPEWCVMQSELDLIEKRLCS